MQKTKLKWTENLNVVGWSQDGREIGWGDHLLPHKYIKRSYACGTTSTKELLNRGPQIPRKANQSVQNEVRQKIKVTKETKNLGT